VQSLRTGGNTIGIERVGSGPLLYGVSLRTYVRGEDLAAATSGLSVKREYFRRLRMRDIHGNRIEKMVPVGGVFRSGEEIHVRLTVQVHDPGRRGQCREVVIRDPLPAGCEAIEEGDAPEYDYVDGMGNWWENTVRRAEARDRQMVFYAPLLRRGKNVFHYRMRSAIPGDYHVLPATASAVYIPEIYGRCAETRRRVED